MSKTAAEKALAWLDLAVMSEARLACEIANALSKPDANIQRHLLRSLCRAEHFSLALS